MMLNLESFAGQSWLREFFCLIIIRSTLNFLLIWLLSEVYPAYSELWTLSRSLACASVCDDAKCQEKIFDSNFVARKEIELCKSGKGRTYVFFGRNKMLFAKNWSRGKFVTRNPTSFWSVTSFSILLDSVITENRK